MTQPTGVRRGLFCLVVIGSLISGHAVCGQDKTSAGLMSLLANPTRFDGKQITVFGFLVLDHQKKHAPVAALFLHEEDAKNLLPNGVMVVPSDQMVREREKFDRMYVMITGTVRVAPTADRPDDLRAVVIRDIQNCRVWSDPRRPIGLKTDGDDPSANKK